MTILTRIRTWARGIKRDVIAIYFASRDPRTPCLVRWLAIGVAAYALSPIDLIPDFIPVLGYLDDLLIVPLGLLLVLRLLPPDVLAAARERASMVVARPRSYAAAAGVIVIWLMCSIGLTWWWLF